jgi:copper homeostasis protein
VSHKQLNTKKMKRTLEICVDSLQSALNAQANGADRIELCDNLFQGGITPSAGKIKLAKEYLKIPVFVLIRPRKSDFLYSDLEFELMLKDIEMAKFFGADGIVSGVLKEDATFDLPRMEALVEATRPLPFTCHRAFDRCSDPLRELKNLADIGVDRILTSGQKPTAMEGLALLDKLAHKAPNGLQIMACGNLLPNNIDPLLKIKQLKEFHAAVLGPIHSKMRRRGDAPMGEEALSEEFEWKEAVPDLIKGLSEKVHGK